MSICVTLNEEQARLLCDDLCKVGPRHYSHAGELLGYVVRRLPELRPYAEAAMQAAFPERTPMLNRHIELLEIGEQLDRDLAGETL